MISISCIRRHGEHPDRVILQNGGREKGRSSEVKLKLEQTAAMRSLL